MKDTLPYPSPDAGSRRNVKRIGVRFCMRVLHGSARWATTPSDSPWLVLVLSAAMGVIFGAVTRPVPLVSLESAQVVAGVVDLPPDSATSIEHTSQWSLLLIQLPAVLLSLGVPESTLYVAGSGLQGALAFSGLSVCALAFSRSAALALLMPALILKVPNLAGHKYPTELTTTAYDGGIVGFYALLLTIGLLSMGRTRSGLFLLALMPAVHASLGAASWVMAAAALPGNRNAFGPLRAARVWWLTGLGVMCASYLIQRTFIQRVPEDFDTGLARELTDAFVVNWDWHRQPADFGSHPGRIPFFFEVDAWILALGGVLLTKGKHAVSRAGRFILMGLMASSGVALLYTVLSEISLTLIPMELRAFMLTRWLNLDSALLPVAVIGTLAYLGLWQRHSGALLTLGLLGTAIAVGLVDRETLLRTDWLGFPLEPAWDHLGLVLPVACVLLVVFSLTGWGASLSFRLRSPECVHQVLRNVVAATLVVGLITKVGAGLFPDAYQGLRDPVLRPSEYFATASDERALQATGDRPGPLLSPIEVAFYWPQLNSRRGLVLDPDIVDILTYAPAAAEPTERVLSEVFGTSVHNAAGWASFARVRSLWERRSPAAWRAIQEKFGVTDVVVPRSWRLELEPVLRSDNLTVYTLAPTKLLRVEAGLDAHEQDGSHRASTRLKCWRTEYGTAKLAHPSSRTSRSPSIYRRRAPGRCWAGRPWRPAGGR